MAKGENITTKFKIDISEFEKGINDAKKNIKLANAQFKAASAGMDDWKNSTEGLQAKLTQLQAILNNEVSKLKIYKQRLQETEKAEKENADRAEELKTKLKELADNGVSKTSDEYKKYEKALNAVEREQAANKKAVEGLRVTILNQQAAVDKTAKEMRSYKSRLDEVKASSKQLDDMADDVEKGIEGIGDGAQNTANDLKDLKDGFTVIKGAVANFISDGINKLIDGFKNFGKEVMDNETALYKFQSKTGKSALEMEKFNKVINELYQENWGDSISDIADSMAIVAQTSKEVDPDKIKELTKNAIILRDTFDFDVNESMRAANMLMDQFGINGQEAFNLIAQGAQKGLDKNGDLLDTINEYSVHYKQLGYTSEEFFNSLVNGAADGTFSVDKLGDAMKEFGIRAKDTATSTDEGFELIGLNADEMRKKFAEGGESARKATETTMKALFGLNDEVKRNQAGVDLFGTMWEDLGEGAIRSIMDINGGISLTNDALKNIETNSVSDLGSQFSAVGRDIKTDLLYPIGKELLPVLKDLAKDAIPPLKSALSFMIKNINPIRSMVLGLATAWGTYKTAQKTANTITLVTNTLMKSSTVATKTNTVATKGATVATKALSLAQKLTPWGMIAGLIAGVTIGLGAYLIASQKSREETNENVKATKELAEEQKKLSETIKEGKSAREDNMKSASEQAATADVLFNKLSELNDVEYKSIAQKETMKQLVGNLNEIMPDLNLKYDEEKDALNMSTEAIKNNIQAQKDLILAKAAQENLIPLAQDIAKLEMENSKLTEQHIKNEQELADVKKKNDEARKKGIQVSSDALAEEARLTDAYSKTNTALKENAERLKELNQEYDETTNYTDRLFNKADIKKKLKELTKICKDAGIDIPKAVSDGIANNKYALPKSVEEMQALISFQSLETKASKCGIQIPKSLSQGIADGSIAPSKAVEQMNQLVSFGDLLGKSNKAGIQVPEEISQGILNGKLTPQAAVLQMENLIEFNELLSKSDLAGQAVPKNIELAILEGKLSPTNAIAEMNKLMSAEMDKQAPKAGVAGSNTGRQYTSNVAAYSSSAYNAGYGIGTNTVRGESDGSNGSYAEGQGTAQKYVDGAGSTFDQLFDIGKHLVGGINKGFSSRADTLFTTARNTVNRMLQEFNRTAEIKSPSRAFARQSKFIPLGIAKGINDNSGSAIGSIKNLTKNLSKKYNETIKGVKQKTKKLKMYTDIADVAQIKSKLNSAKNSILESNVKVSNNVKDNVEKAKSQIVYNQYISSPKATDRMEIRRQTKNTLRMIGSKV